MSDEPTAAGGLAEHDPRPIVRLAGSGPSGFAIAAVAAVLAGVLFFWIERSRGARASQTSTPQVAAFAPVPALVVPPEPKPVPGPPAEAIASRPSPPIVPPLLAPPARSTPFVPFVPPEAPPPVIRAAVERPARVNEQALVIDDGVEVPSTPARPTPSGDRVVTPAGTAAAAATPATTVEEPPVRAALLGNPTTTMPVGTIIAAILETPIDTARPGLARAIVADDVSGFDGKRVLISRGSRLIGEFQSDVRPGQNRVLVTWTRLIRADGATIRLASPAADALGGAGVPGRVHSFFFERFTAALLQSALTVGVNLASRAGSGSVIVEGSGQGLNGVVGQQLLPGNDLKPKITIRQGAAISVFVAHDLDFSGVPALKRATVP